MRESDHDKRANGRFYTRGNPFSLKPFRSWAQRANLKNECVLEPFAGANHLIKSLIKLELCNQFASFDVSPNDEAVTFRDTLKEFPNGYHVCVTNPPWLAKNSATRRRLPYPDTKYDDVYKHCLHLCLQHCSFVGALVPASFLHSGILRERLSTYILLHKSLFSDTENPVCLALFEDKPATTTAVYYDDEHIGDLARLEKHLPQVTRNKQVKFNNPEGNLGFISFDNTRHPSIRFCNADEIKTYKIKESSRFITRISGNFNCTEELINHLNKNIDRFRENTKDIFLTPFKGIRKDGYYRRRMDFNLAKRFIAAD